MSSCSAHAEIDPAKVIRLYLRAWGEADVAAVVALYDPDVELHWSGVHRFAGRYRGLEALRALAALQVATRRSLHEVHDVLVGRHGVAVDVTEHWSVPRTDGVSPPVAQVVDVRRLLVYTVSRGLITSCRVYDHDAVAVRWLLEGTTRGDSEPAPIRPAPHAEPAT